LGRSQLSDQIEKEVQIPSVIVTATADHQREGAMTLSGQKSVADHECGHFASRLIERLRSGVADAHAAERSEPGEDARDGSATPFVDAADALEVCMP
jgi:hypothetical protein